MDGRCDYYMHSFGGIKSNINFNAAFSPVSHNVEHLILQQNKSLNPAFWNVLTRSSPGVFYWSTFLCKPAWFQNDCRVNKKSLITRNEIKALEFKNTVALFKGQCQASLQTQKLLYKYLSDTYSCIHSFCYTFLQHPAYETLYLWWRTPRTGLVNKK